MINMKIYFKLLLCIVSMNAVELIPAAQAQSTSGDSTPNGSDALYNQLRQNKATDPNSVEQAKRDSFVKDRVAKMNAFAKDGAVTRQNDLAAAAKNPAIASGKKNAATVDDEIATANNPVMKAAKASASPATNEGNSPSSGPVTKVSEQVPDELSFPGDAPAPAATKTIVKPKALSH
jgi:hypothetical protein